MTTGSPDVVGWRAGAARERSSRFPTRNVRLRTVLAWNLVESGNTSPRKSATLPNGISAANLAVRYRSSGAMGDRRVNNAGTVFGASVRHGHA